MKAPSLRLDVSSIHLEERGMKIEYNQDAFETTNWSDGRMSDNTVEVSIKKIFSWACFPSASVQ